MAKQERIQRKLSLQRERELEREERQKNAEKIKLNLNQKLLDDMKKIREEEELKRQ